MADLRYYNIIIDFSRLLSCHEAYHFRYLNDVKNAPKERSKLSLEAANLLPLLNSLRDQVENASPNDPWIESVLELGGTTGPLELFKRTMEQLKRKLKVESPMLRMGKYVGSSSSIADLCCATMSFS